MTHFHLTTTGEPHAKRRMEILEHHPEIKSLFGTDSFTAVVTAFVVAAQIVISAFVSRIEPSLSTGEFAVFILVFSYLVGSILNHWAAMTVHECSHYLVFKNKNANRWLALFANIPFIFPFSMTFIRYHVGHHAKLGVLGEDTDLPLDGEVRAVGKNRIKKFFWVFFNFFFYSGRAVTFMKSPDRWELLNILWQTVFTALLVYAFGWFSILYLILSTVFGMSIHPVSAHFIHEHYGFKNGQETYSYYGPLNKVAFNVGYHNEHHDFMQVPGSKLPALKKIAAPYYDPLTHHHSWTRVLLEFIFRRDLSLSDRIVRTREDFNKGRESLRHRKVTE